MIVTEFFLLSGRTALVTGCSRGIGMSMAIGLAEGGADIIGVSHSLAPGAEVEREVEARGVKFFSYAANLGDKEALYSFIARVKSEHPVIDILVNNAGTITSG